MAATRNADLIADLPRARCRGRRGAPRADGLEIGRAGGRGAGKDELLRRRGGAGADGANRLEDLPGGAVEADPEDAAVGEPVGELRGREERDETPLHEDGEAVGEALDVSEVVRGEEDRPPLAPPALDEGIEGGEPLGVEGSSRFVEEEERRVGERGDGETEALDHPARVRRYGARGGSVQAREPEDLGRAGRGNATETPVELHDLAPRQGVGESHLLGEERETPAGGRLRGGASVHEDLPRRGVDEAGDGLQAGRLARPVRPEQRDDLAGSDLERDAVHGDLRAVGLSEAVESDHSVSSFMPRGDVGPGRGEPCRGRT
jgi:hypothetical protein